MSPWESLAALYPIVALSATKQLFFSLCVFEWSDCFFVASKVNFLPFLFFLHNFDTGAFSGNFLVAIASWLFVASQPRGLHDFPFSARGRDDQPCSVVHFSWYAFVSVKNLNYP